MILRPLAVAGDTPSHDAHPVAAIPAVTERMLELVAAREIAGAVTLVATRDQVVHCNATGWADVTTQKPMRPDAIFWIASMTKPITATAVLMLHEQGKLSVEDPVAKYLPDFTGLKTRDGRPAEITLRHLLTHTSGLAEITPDQARKAQALVDLVPLYTSQPAQFTPGSRWVYSQSGINTLARIVEVVSGQSFVEFLDRRLFQPLGMRDTTFYLSQQRLERLAKSYRRTEAGTWEEAELFILLGKSPTSRDRFPAANGGLFSTARDYARFCQMILNGGQLDGRRYLEPQTVRLMTTLQTGSLKTGFTDGNGWGLGWCIIRQPQGATEVLSPGSFGHGGAYGTQAWIDPIKERIYILMVQRANFPNADDSSVRRAFQTGAAAALDE